MTRAMYAIPAVGLLWSGCGQVEKPVCGNGIVEMGEECDDGNAVDTDDCPTTCIAPKCNDGFVQAGVEECDDGNAVETDGCTSDCQLDPVLRKFEITTHRGVPLTNVANYRMCTGTDQYSNCISYTTCNKTFASPLTMSMASMALTASGSYTRTLDCVDNASDMRVTKALSGIVEVLVTRQLYRISLTEDMTAVVLTCDMDVAGNLSCTDGAAKVWTLARQ
jgi:cysteine-rich repeat protein